MTALIMHTDIDTVKEVAAVVHGLCTTNPDKQKETLYRFFTADAAFEHPFCRVKAGPNSREAVLGIYQFYKQLSPTIKLSVNGAAFDEPNQRMYLDVRQRFQLWFAPWHTSDVQLTVVLHLRRREDGKWLIAKQADYYEPEDFLDFLPVPFLKRGVLLLKHFATLNCNLGAIINNAVGWQAPSRSPTAQVGQ